MSGPSFRLVDDAPDAAGATHRETVVFRALSVGREGAEAREDVDLAATGLFARAGNSPRAMGGRKNQVRRRIRAFIEDRRRRQGDETKKSRRRGRMEKSRPEIVP